ncbi:MULTISPECIES: STM4015 family protein [Nonomuraea]|uniref:STM4015 family protein n=1 Tax=Nonomuraea ferruginea TaxID=46174 RepID=A0ABT4T2P8_9ACTN|nr:STM4015 family protein [Nonomuraea ferruginea]MDA0643783.1 STM4015 family protein [Nonomuraea ferruginea]
MIEYDHVFGYQQPHNDTYAGLPVVHVLADDDDLPAADAAAWRFQANDWGDGPDTMDEGFDWFFEHVDTSRVKAVVIGAWEECYTKNSAHIVSRLADNASRLPELRSLFLGAITSQEAEISWIRQSDITPLLEAYPRLTRLEVRGGSGLGLSPVRHQALRILRVETGGLPGEMTRAIAASDLPALEHLELWLGEENYGGDTAVSDLAPILSGERLPALRHLGLQDSEIQDEIAAAVATAPVVARLESLGLSMGALTDAGAESLLTGQPLTHLRALDLHHHYLTASMMRRVADALPGVRVDLSEQETPEEDWRYIAVSE